MFCVRLLIVRFDHKLYAHFLKEATKGSSKRVGDAYSTYAYYPQGSGPHLLSRAGNFILQICFAQDPTATEADDLGMLLLQMLWLLSPCAILSARSLAAQMSFSMVFEGRQRQAVVRWGQGVACCGWMRFRLLYVAGFDFGKMVFDVMKKADGATGAAVGPPLAIGMQGAIV